MTRYLRSTGIVFLAFLASASTVLAQPQWQYKVDRFGSKPREENRRAAMEQTTTVLGSTCSTRLQFMATQDQGEGVTGLLSLEFTVSPAESIKGFDFRYFEGPDAPGGDQKLMRITVTRADKRFVHTFYQAGYWSAEVDGGFVFETSDVTRDKRSPFRKLLNQLREGGQSLEIAVTDGKNPARVISVTYPLSGSKSVFKALLEGL